MSLSDLFNLSPVITSAPKPKDDGLAEAINTFIFNSPKQFNTTEIFRCSEIAFMCPRQKFFNFYRPKQDKIEPATQLIMDVGTEFHKVLQNKVLGRMQILWGNWKKDNEIKEGFHPDPADDSWEYIEQKLFNKEYNLSGHIDGLISLTRIKFINDNKNLYKFHFDSVNKEIKNIDPGELALLDMKLVNQRNFSLAQTEEVPSFYKMQGALYMWMLGLKKEYFLYGERENMSLLGKIYEFEPAVLEEALKKITVTNNQFIVGEPTNEFRFCRTPSDKRAKKCPHAEECFNHKLNYKEFIEKSSNKHSGIKLPIL